LVPRREIIIGTFERIVQIEWRPTFYKGRFTGPNQPCAVDGWRFAHSGHHGAVGSVDPFLKKSLQWPLTK